MTEELILTELGGRLWHTTHPDRFQCILNGGSILPEPKIPDSDRWKTSRGKDYYPYARMLGGVSLFDLHQFDPESYSQRCPMCSWREFVPYRTSWGCAIWIEIDRDLAASRLISATELVAKWKSEGAEHHTIMPYIEAVHLGPLPQTAFKRVFLVRKENIQFFPLAL